MNLLEKIKNALTKKGIKINITSKTIIKDLGLDSLDLMDLVIELEKQESILIPDEELLNFKTIGDIIDSINKNKK